MARPARMNIFDSSTHCVHGLKLIPEREDLFLPHWCAMDDFEWHGIGTELRGCFGCLCPRFHPGDPSQKHVNWMDQVECDRRLTVPASSLSPLDTSTSSKPSQIQPPASHFRLFDLAQEVRDLIYEFALCPEALQDPGRFDDFYRKSWLCEEPFDLKLRGIPREVGSPNIHTVYDQHVPRAQQPPNTNYTVPSEHWWKGEPALTRTSYQVRQETLPIYYGRRTIIFHLCPFDPPYDNKPEWPISSLKFCPVFSAEKLALCRSIEFSAVRAYEDAIQNKVLTPAEWDTPKTAKFHLFKIVEAVEKTGLDWDALNISTDLGDNQRHYPVRYEHPGFGFVRDTSRSQYMESFEGGNKYSYIPLAHPEFLADADEKARRTGRRSLSAYYKIKWVMRRGA